MKKAVIDASALLRLVDNEAGADRMESYFDQARSGTIRLSMPAVNWGEVVYVILKVRGTEGAEALLPRLKSLPFRIVEITVEAAEQAAQFKHAHGVHYADAFAGSLAASEGATLVTADYDFHSIPSAKLNVDILPRKERC